MLGEESTRIRWLSERAALRCEDQAAMQRPGKNRSTGWRPARRRNRARSSGSGGYLGQKWASPDPVNGILCRRCDLALAIKFWLAHVVKKFMNVSVVGDQRFSEVANIGIGVVHFSVQTYE